MAMPGITDENEVKKLLKKVLDSPDEIIKFAVVAAGPKEGELVLSKLKELKRKEVQAAAEEESKGAGGKAAKFDVIVGECRLDAPASTKLRLSVYGKAVAKAVACAEHLLTRGPYKTVGFTEVVLVEVEEPVAGQPPVAAPSAPSPSPSQAPPPAPPSASPQAPPNQAAGAPGTTAAPATSDVSRRFSERLAALLPAIKGAAGTPVGDAAKLKASEAGALARAQNFEQANQLLTEVEVLLRSVPPARAAGSAGPDPAKEFNERLTALIPLIKSAAGSPQGDEAKTKAGEAAVLAKKQDFTGAHALLDAIEQLVAASPSPDVPGLAIWQEARLDAIDDLELVIEAVRATNDPDATKVEIVLKSIVKNLTERPDTPSAVAELRRYLETDDVITAAEEVPAQYGSLDLRGPLLAALDSLSP